MKVKSYRDLDYGVPLNRGDVSVWVRPSYMEAELRWYICAIGGTPELKFETKVTRDDCEQLRAVLDELLTDWALS